MNRYPVVVREMPGLPVGTKGVPDEAFQPHEKMWLFETDEYSGGLPESIWEQGTYKGWIEWREDKPEPVRAEPWLDNDYWKEHKKTSQWWFSRKLTQADMDKMLAAINGELFTTDQLRKAFADNWSEWRYIVRASDIIEALLKELRHGNE